MAESILLSMAANILGSAIGLVCGIPYDSLTNKLKKGDVTNEKVREIIVRDLTEIKAKLDCLSLKDLDSSYSFLKEGVRLLNLALKDKKSSDGKDEATGISNDGAFGILNAALSLPHAFQRLKISSEDRFVSAKDCFKEARKAATHAFNNKSLSIKDRIMACKLRVAARILESGLEDPEVATTACLVSLEELHGLPEIQRMFTVFLKGGLRSMVTKAERLENIMSVLFINHALFDFAARYSSECPNVFTWPVIDHRSLNPILHTREILAKASTSKELVQQLNRTVIAHGRCGMSCFVVNSRGEVIMVFDDKISVIYSTGEIKDVTFPDPTVEQVPKAVAVDGDDNVYLVVWLKTRDENGIREIYVLYVFDENYNLKHSSKFDFLDAKYQEYENVKITVDKNRNLIMIKEGDFKVYVCDNTGQLKFTFEQDGCRAYSMSSSDKNGIIIPSDDRCALHTYTTEGHLKSTMKLPEGQEVWDVAFHHGICRVIVLACLKRQNSWFLLRYSETGKLENSVFIHKDVSRILNISSRPGGLNVSSHPGGPIALKWDNVITFI